MKQLYILGFGCAEKGEITLRTLETLKQSDKVYVRTMHHPAAEILREYSINYTSFDDYYNKYEDFDSLYEAIADTVLASKEAVVSYIVPGSAVFAEKSVVNILKKACCPVEIVPSVSFLDGIFAALKTDAANSFKLIDALRLDEQTVDTTTTNVICQVYDKDIASDVKLYLMEKYEDDKQIYLVTAASANNQKISNIKLYELDRCDEINHLSCVVVPYENSDTKDFYAFMNIIRKLRSENGCPWDKAQTHKSLIPYIIEEAYETVDAIENSDTDNMCEELGDVLLQIALHSVIAEENAEFRISDVIKIVSEKMIRRHPHVFADIDLPKDYYKMWDEIKAEEHSYKTHTQQLQAIAKSLPALIYAQKLQKKASKAGMDFNGVDEAINKIPEELKEFISALQSGNKEKINEEAGDLLFAAVNAIRLADVNAEDALKKASAKFLKRFEKTEQLCCENGEKMENIGNTKLNEYWEAIKKCGF